MCYILLLLFFQWFVIIGLNKIRTLFHFKGALPSTDNEIYCFKINKSLPYLVMPSSCLGQDIERHEKEKGKRRGG